MSELSTTELIFQGTKAYWRTRNTVDLIVVHHLKHNLLEVVTYEPSFDREAPRIYLDNAVLDSKIDKTDIEEKLKAAKEPILRRREVPDNEKLLKQIMNSEKVAYILNRLFVTEFTPEDRVIRVELQFNFRDHDDAHSTGTEVSAITRSKADDLVPYKSPNYLTLLEGVVDILADDLRREVVNFQEYRSLVSLYGGSGYEDVLFTRRERWRIPFVYAKLKNGKALSKRERRIWQVLTRGVRPEEAVAIVGRALDIPLSAEALEEIARQAAERAQRAAAKPTPKRANKRGSFIRGSFGGGAGGTTPTAKTTRRGSMTFTAGLSALTESMKRRVGLSVNTEAVVEGQEGGEGTDGDAKKTVTSRTPKTTTRGSASPGDHPVGRTTNISVTPKPRSYLIKPKRRSIIRAMPSIDAGTASGEDATSAPQTGAGQLEKSSEDTTTAAAESHVPFRAAGNMLSTSGKFAAAVADGLSARLSASVAAFTNAIRGTFSSKGRVGSVRVLAAPDMPDGEDDEFNAPAPVASTAGASGASGTTGALTGMGSQRKPAATTTMMQVVVPEEEEHMHFTATSSLDALAEDSTAAAVPVFTVQSPIGETKSFKGDRAPSAAGEAPLEQ